MKWQLVRMLKALEKPILNYDDFADGDYENFMDISEEIEDRKYLKRFEQNLKDGKEEFIPTE